MSNKRNLAVGTLMVAAAGYVAGLLTAPKSGRETRKDIRDNALKAKGEAERKLKQGHSELTKLLAEAAEVARNSKNLATEEFKKAVEKADAIRLKAKDVLSSVHEGDAGDDDLHEALEDVKAAIKHLKQYATKSHTK